MKRVLVLLLLILVVMSLGLAGCADDSSSSEPAADTEESAPAPADTEAGTDTDPDRALVENKCSLCHTTDRVWAADYDRPTWETTIDRMKTNGLVITDEEYEQIVTYLSEQ
jgi:cytochrome c5